MRFLFVISVFLLSLYMSFAQAAENGADTEPLAPKASEEERLVSPIGAIVRSAILPGWGQFYSRGYIRGSLTVLGIGGSVVGALLASESFKNRYKVYATYASLNPNDDQGVLERYEFANQRYQLRTFFMYTGIGIWVYSLIDSYVGANFYNATTLIRSIERDAQDIDKLGLEVQTTPSRLYFGIVKTF